MLCSSETDFETLKLGNIWSGRSCCQLHGPGILYVDYFEINNQYENNVYYKFRTRNLNQLFLFSLQHNLAWKTMSGMLKVYQGNSPLSK